MPPTVDALSWTALALLVAYLLVTFGLRSWIQWRRTGSTGFRGISGRPGTVEWWSGVLVVLAFAAAPAAIAVDLTGTLARIAPLSSGASRWIGLGVLIAGFTATFAAQLAMGASWRIGVRADEVTALVTTGPFAFVRNPIYTAMLTSGLGLALLVPNALAVAAWVVALLALELQVRFVEEPYLHRIHGDAYAAYARRVGRFVPGFGRPNINE